MVSLGYYNGNAWQHICGGAIVSKRIILTAANCFNNVDRDLYFPEQPADLTDIDTEYISDSSEESEEETVLVSGVVPLVKPR